MSLFSAIGALPAAALRQLTGAPPEEKRPSRARRVVQTGPGRAYLSIRGVHRVEGEPLARAAERALRAVEGVHWAEVNPVLAQVVVAFEDGSVDVDDLAGVIDDVEEAHGAGDDDLPADLPLHPADAEPIRRGLLALAADGAGVAMGVVGLVMRLPRLPVELASIIPAVDSFPPVRRLLETRPAAETGAATLNAVLQGFGQGPLGLLVDAAHRVSLVGELTARRRSWLEAEPQLHGGPRSEPLAPVATEPRPVPLPAGLVDRYGQAASLSSLAGGGLALALTRDPRRTADVLLAGIPRAARLGRDGFAAQLGRGLAARQVVPMDPRVLRRLDRIDTVLVDAEIVTTGGSVVGEVLVLGEHVRDERQRQVQRIVEALFDPDEPERPRARDAWTLVPLQQLDAPWPEGAKGRAREVSERSVAMLGLTDKGALVAVVGLVPELHALGLELAAATRRAGHQLLVGGGGRALAGALGADRELDGGKRLVASVRALQQEGRVVAVVSSRHHAVLRAADCGIGVMGPAGAHPPWGAHLLCQDLAEAVAVVEATRLARTASRQAVAIAAGGSAAAGLFALGPVPGAGRRAVTAVQVASLTALGAGTWTAAQLPKPLPRREARPVAWHALAADEVFGRLGAGGGGPAGGRTAAGDQPSDGSPWAGLPGIVLGELSNPLSVVLAAGAALSAAAGSVIDALLIAGVLGVDALLGASQRVRTEVAIGRLTAAVTEGAARVERDGVEVPTSIRALQAGDVVRLEAGDAVPADCRVLEAVSLEVDESSLTGESFPVEKQSDPVERSVPVAERTSMVYGGTAVAAGRGRAVVVATGTDTEAGRGAVRAERPPTGVESRLRSLTNKTVPVVLGAGAGLALNSLVRGLPPREALSSGVSLAAAAVPEGLPFVATVAQASAAHRLATRGVLVRNPEVLEALGRVDVLCFDKTGTLTEGRLQLRLVCDGERAEALAEMGPASRQVLAAALRATPRPRGGILPHPTDQAVVDGATIARVRPGLAAPGWRKTASLPFEPGRAYHAVVGRTRSGTLLGVKGAPEVVLPRCTKWRRASGESVALEGSARTQVEQMVEELAGRGLRVLAVAERAGVEATNGIDDEQLEELELFGFLGVADASRDSASAPIEQLSRAGINVVMVTGDHPHTAEAVARELGLLNGRRVLGAVELDELDDEELEKVLDEVAVFARVTPAHKVRIVAAFQRAGRVVAMTGDGANDAQAISLAQIGVAFGSRATSAARGAADLVVASDDLDVLIDSVVEGRAMWASVRDALAILLGGNLGEVAFTTSAALVTGRSPLNARQLLAVNLFTDLAPAMAIAVQPPRTRRVDLAREGPETSLAGPLARDVAIRAAATAAGAYGAWLTARATGTPTRARTVALAALVGSQLGQTLVIGRRSPLVAGSALLSAAGLVAVIQIPGLSQFFGCRPLGPVGWAIATGASGLATAGSVAATVLLPR
jgi:cation-transporting P-type ATPase I